MNATAPAPTTVSSTADVAHIAVWRRGEWEQRFASATPKRALCGAERPPRLNANDLPVCAECKRLSRQEPTPAPLW